MLSQDPSLLLAALRHEFSQAADPARAPGMQAYMKSTMPFWGVPMLQMRKICKQIFKDLPLSSAPSFEKQTIFLWNHATHREERYAAIEWTRDRRARPFHTTALLPMYKSMIVSGAWWDLVDAMVHQLGLILRIQPTEAKLAMASWSQSSNMWVRRAAILCQLGAKEKTDPDLLYACIEPSLGSKEFFLRKAVGWALRQYARYNPEEVLRYTERNKNRLSNLSLREAIKNIK